MISERSVKAVSEKLKNLERLDISDCRGITGMDCFYLKKLKNLKLLLIRNVKFCDNEVKFLDDLKNLETLSISNAVNLTNGCLEIIAKKCSSIVNINFQGNNKFTEQGLFNFVREMKNLKNLRVESFFDSQRIQNLLRNRRSNL